MQLQLSDFAFDRQSRSEIYNTTQLIINNST